MALAKESRKSVHTLLLLASAGLCFLRASCLLAYLCFICYFDIVALLLHLFACCLLLCVSSSLMLLYCCLFFLLISCFKLCGIVVLVILGGACALLGGSLVDWCLLLLASCCWKVEGCGAKVCMVTSPHPGLPSPCCVQARVQVRTQSSLEAQIKGEQVNGYRMARSEAAKGDKCAMKQRQFQKSTNIHIS